MADCRLISITPDAEAEILYCARVSSNQDNSDTNLIRYLIEHGHWSPFEMAHAVMEINTSRAIAAQILRHRSFSFQEFSQRYSNPSRALIYKPRQQAVSNRQSSEGEMSLEDEDWWVRAQFRVAEYAFSVYDEAIRRGIARECARFVLPLATETKLYMAGTIRSWIHYLQMRTDEHTQLEHRKLALEMQSHLAEHLPTIESVLWAS